MTDFWADSRCPSRCEDRTNIQNIIKAFQLGNYCKIGANASINSPRPELQLRL